jgi:hypothetical protein
MALEYEERLRVQELFDVYDLIEVLDLSVLDILDAFEEKIEGNVEVLEKIGSIG